MTMLFAWISKVLGSVNIKLIILGIVAAGIFYLGYSLGSARADRVELAVATKLNEDLVAMTQARDLVEKLMTRELSIAHKELQREQDTTLSLLTTNKRMLLAGRCVQASGESRDTGVGTGARVELDRTARQAYFDLRRGINIVENKLSTCQSILTVIQENKNEPK